MYLSSHTRGIPKKSGPSDQFRTYSGPLLALRSGSGPSPEFRTLVVPLYGLRHLLSLSPKLLAILLFLLAVIRGLHSDEKIYFNDMRQKEEESFKGG